MIVDLIFTFSGNTSEGSTEDLDGKDFFAAITELREKVMEDQ